jgi:hypothetical protein
MTKKIIIGFASIFIVWLIFINMQSEDINLGDNTVQQLFPAQYNVKYEFTTPAGDVHLYSVFNTFITEERVQRKVISPSGNFVEVIQIQDGSVTLIYASNIEYFYEDITDIEPSMEVVLLQEPLVLGNSWEHSINTTSEITGVNIEVQTQAGTFNTIEVTNTSQDGTIEINHYAPYVGLVKTVIYGGQMQFEAELSAIITDTQLQIYTQFFVYDVVNDEIVEEIRTVQLTTNMNYYEMLEKQMRKHTQNQVPSITENTTINSIIVNRQDSLAKIDLSQGFVEELNVGANIEMQMLLSIKSTISSFYNVDDVIITIEGETYESGHM